MDTDDDNIPDLIRVYAMVVVLEDENNVTTTVLKQSGNDITGAFRSFALSPTGISNVLVYDEVLEQTTSVLRSFLDGESTSSLWRLRCTPLRVGREPVVAVSR